MPHGIRFPTRGGATYATALARSSASGLCDRLALMSVPQEKLLKVCEDILAPLIRADGGELFVVAIEADSISLHLAGKCSGCPGATLTSSAIIEPAIRAVAPAMRVVVTSGFQVPAGAAPVVAQAGAA